MATEVQTKAKELQAKIMYNDYYVALYIKCLVEMGMTQDGINELKYDDAALINMCHEFWSELSDSMAIQRPPFHDLCDIAERIFGDDE